MIQRLEFDETVLGQPFNFVRRVGYEFNKSGKRRVVESALCSGCGARFEVNDIGVIQLFCEVHYIFIATVVFLREYADVRTVQDHRDLQFFAFLA